MKLLVQRVWRWFEYPPRFSKLHALLARDGARLLDAGCGNHSPALTKRHYPNVEYHGIDNSEWNRDAADDKALDKFYDLSLDDEQALATVPDSSYDVVICSHVLEHLEKPLAVASQLVDKARAGGKVYFEVPSPATVRWPQAIDGWYGIKGCLNFYDDPTHIRPVDLREVAAELRKSGHLTSRVKKRRMARRVVLLPLYAVAGIATRRYVPASVVWDITGFAETLVVTRA